MIQAYIQEHYRYPEYAKEVSGFYARMIVKKLTRHFKIDIRFVRFYGNSTGHARFWRREITLHHNSSIGLICHEVNHFLCWKKYGTSKGKARHGSKKWYRQLNRIVLYARKKNFWQEEFERRANPKPPKPEPTPRELRLKKIERLEQGIKRHQTKIKRCQTLIKKNNRRISALKRFI